MHLGVHQTKRLTLLFLFPVLSCGGKTRESGGDGSDDNPMGLGGAADGDDNPTGGKGGKPSAGGTGASGGTPSVGGMPSGGRPNATGAASGDGGSAASGGAHAGGAGGAGGADPTSGGSSGAGGTNGPPSGVFPCIGAYYDIDPDPDLYQCIAWTVCEPGTRLTAGGTLTKDRECEECPEGTFTDTSNQTYCADHRRCELGLSIVEAGTAHSDVVCGPTQGAFPAIEFGSSVIWPRLAATDEALYATLGRSDVVRMSFDGQDVRTRTITTGQDEIVTDVLGLNDAHYVVTIGDVARFNPLSNSAGFLASYDGMGNRLWQVDFEEGFAYQNDTRLASDGTHLYVARAVQPCLEEGEYCTPQGVSQLLLSAYDVDGNVLWETNEELERDFAGIMGIAVAGDVLHVGVEAIYTGSIRRYELTGDFIDERFSGDEDGVRFRFLAPTPEGGVAFFEETATLWEVPADEAPLSIPLGSSTERLSPLVVGPDTVFLAGLVAQTNDVLLQERSRTGELLSSWTLGGPQVDEATAMVRAPNGELYFSGVTTSQLGVFLFIQPWPQ